MTEPLLVPKALRPIGPGEAIAFGAAFEAALAALGCEAITDGDGRVLYPADATALVNEARRIALDACDLPYVMVPEPEQFAP
jgi:hypothetical protein